MSELTGKALGPYQIIETIGKGGMAEIYRAYQPSTKRDVVVKVLFSNLRNDPGFVDRFKRELDIIAHLQHPHIIPVIDFGEEDDQLYIVMAYLKGGSLADRIAGTQYGLEIDETLRLINLIASGLDYAHSMGIIHRDLKPSNILMDEHGNPYIADFGIAKRLDGRDDATNTIMSGTAGYIAPEIAQSGRSTKKADIYALGIILFEMLTGRMPYVGRNPYKILSAHVNQEIPNLLDFRSELPASFQAVIEKALAKKPEERFSSAGELANALRTK